MNGIEFLNSVNVSQAMLSRRMGCSRQNVTVWFTGKKACSARSIEKITEALNELGVKVTQPYIYGVLLASRQEYEKTKGA